MDLLHTRHTQVLHISDTANTMLSVQPVGQGRKFSTTAPIGKLRALCPGDRSPPPNKHPSLDIVGIFDCDCTQSFCKVVFLIEFGKWPITTSLITHYIDNKASCRIDTIAHYFPHLSSRDGARSSRRLTHKF